MGDSLPFETQNSVGLDIILELTHFWYIYNKMLYEIFKPNYIKIKINELKIFKSSKRLVVKC